jgi:hypothetical protein
MANFRAVRVAESSLFPEFDCFSGNCPGGFSSFAYPRFEEGDRLNFVADWQRRYTVVGFSFLAVVIC